MNLNCVRAIFSRWGIYKSYIIRLLLPSKLYRLYIPFIGFTSRLTVDLSFLFILILIMESYWSRWILLIEAIVFEITILTFIFVIKRYLPLHCWHLQLSPWSIWANDNFRMEHILILFNVLIIRGIPFVKLKVKERSSLVWHSGYILR